MPLSTWAAYPENSWPSVSGVASWVWVRPILTIWANAFSFWRSARRSSLSAGISSALMLIAAAMCMAVGNESFED